jgi:hypothetical protein
MRSSLLVAICVAGLGGGCYWCFNGPWFLPGEKTKGPTATTTFDQDRAVKDYMNRVPMYDVSAKTEKKQTVTVTTITYTPKPKQ